MRVFLSAPAGQASRFVSATLRGMGIDVVDVFSLSAGESIQRGLRDLIASADLCICILSPPGDWQMFELGVASALGKPVALISDPTFALPALVDTKLHIQTPLTDERLIASFLRTVVADVGVGPSQPVEPAVPAALNTQQVDLLLEQARHVRVGGTYRELETLVFRVLASTGLRHATNVETRVEGRLHEADAIVYAPSIAQLLGSPLLIEVKGGRMSTSRFEETCIHLLGGLRFTGAKTALLVYLSSDGRRLPNPHQFAPAVLAMDLEDLLAALRERPFEEVLVVLRNRAVHGA